MGQAILWGLYKYLLCLLEVILLFDFSKHMLNRKKETKNSLYYSSITILSIFIYFLTQINIYPTGRIIIIFLIFFYTISRLFNGNITQKIYSLSVFYFFLIFADIVTVNILSKVIGKDIQNTVLNQTWGSILMSQISKLLLFISLRIIKNNSKEKDTNIPKYYWYWILLVYLISGVNLLAIFNIGVILNELNLEIQYLTILVSIGSLLIVAITYYIFIKLNEVYKERSNYKIVEIKNEMLIKEIEEKEKIYEEVRKIHHDFKNHIICIEKLLEQEKLESAKNYINILRDEVIETYTWIKTGNDVVDAILNQKKSEGKKKNINIDIKASISSDMNINPLDLCVVIGNVLDNGIEANEKIVDISKRYVDVNINTYKDYLCIEVSNPVSVNPINEHGNLETTKENKNNHGLGIKSIQAIVKKYNGILNYEWNNGIFKLNIMLQIR